MDKTTDQSSFQSLYALADAEGKFALDERAAIYEYEANYRRDQAEELAALEYVMRNQPVGLFTFSSLPMRAAGEGVRTV